MSIIQKMMNFLTPPTSKEVRASLDKESLQNIFRVCTVVLCVEVTFLLVFLIKNNPLTHEETQITYRVCICIAVCIAGVLSTKFLLGRKRLNHRAVFFIKTIFYVVFSVWAIYADCQHYIKGEQMLTLAAVELLMVCFLLLRPWASILLTSALFVFLYFILFSIDGAAGIQSYNYLVLAIALAVVEPVIRLLYQMLYGEAGNRFSGSESHCNPDITVFAFTHIIFNGLPDLFNCKQSALKGLVHHYKYFFSTPAAYHIL